MRHDGGLEGIAVTAVRVIRLGGVSLDLMGLVAQHAAHARAHMLHHALGIGAVVHILHALEQAPEVVLALAQLFLDLVLVRHVHAADQQGRGTIECDAHGRDQHHAQMAFGGANTKLGRLVGQAGLLWRTGLLKAVTRTQLVQRVHKVGQQAALHIVECVCFQQNQAGRVGTADHTVLGDQHGHWQGVHQFRVAKHGSGIS